MIDMTLWRGVAWYIAALLISVLGFVVLNAGYTMMFPACIACHAHVGVPFGYLDTGGFEGGGGLLWRGVFADLLLRLAAALVLALVLPYFPTSGHEVICAVEAHPVSPFQSHYRKLPNFRIGDQPSGGQLIDGFERYLSASYPFAFIHHRLRGTHREPC